MSAGERRPPLVLRYARKHWKYFALLAAFAAIFLAVFWLYGLPLEPVLYGGALCAAIGAMFVLVGFLRFRARHARLTALAERFEAEHLPAAQDAIEADYHAILRALERREREAENRLSEARRDLVDYYTMWAHQIKTPIAAMRLLLQTGATREELEEELFRIEQYVEMALGYLRSESLSGDLLVSRCDLDAIVRGCVRKYRKQFIRKRIALRYEPLRATVLTDAKWLAFVIEQLLANALKYTPQGSIAIEMAADRPDALVIADTGIGIRAEDLPRVFEKGYTGFNGREGDRRATGIGLYLCKRILARLGHTIEIESSPGHGTRVILGLDSLDVETE